MAKKGGDLIAEFLIKQKVPYIFGICGHGNVGFLDALYDVKDELKLISPRHEQTAGHMADAYFRVKHEPVATLTSCGPGSSNMVMPLALTLSNSRHSWRSPPTFRHRSSTGDHFRKSIATIKPIFRV